MAITGRGMDFTVHTGFTAARLTGAGTIITGANTSLCRRACISRNADESGDRVLTICQLRFCFDFLKSRLL